MALADNKCRFALKDGNEKGTRPTFPDSAYFAGTLLPEYIVGKKPGLGGGFPEITGHSVALIRAGGHIIAAGQPRPADSKPELRWGKRPQVVLDLPEDDPGRFPEPSGNELWLFPAEGGPALARLPLPAAPTFDGLAVVEGKLFVSCSDGKLRCFSNP